MNSFKTIVLALCIAATIFGLLVFARVIPIGNNSSTTKQMEGSITLWGTLPDRDIRVFLQDYSLRNQSVRISYEEKNPTTFSDDLVEALASGSAPDLIILPDNLINRFDDKLTHISFASLPAATFKDTFVSGASIFMAADGAIAIPWATDPIVMYYNRDFTEGAGIVKPPALWKDFSEAVVPLSMKKPDLTITQSGAALGTYTNIAHAKDIIAMLFLQNGNPFITYAKPVKTHFGIGSISGTDVGPQVLDFYTAFADPVKDVYTWNAGMPLDRTAFTQSTLVYYFGTASELPLIRAANPNLNFDIAIPPQSKPATPATTGRMYGLAIPKSAPNQMLSYTAATLLSDKASSSALALKAGTSLALVPVRRDVLSEKPTSDPYLARLYQAALIQKTWFDPNPVRSDAIFAGVIKDIASGIANSAQALSKASTQITALSR